MGWDAREGNRLGGCARQGNELGSKCRERETGWEELRRQGKLVQRVKCVTRRTVMADD